MDDRLAKLFYERNIMDRIQDAEEDIDLLQKLQAIKSVDLQTLPPGETLPVYVISDVLYPDPVRIGRMAVFSDEAGTHVDDYSADVRYLSIPFALTEQVDKTNASLVNLSEIHHILEAGYRYTFRAVLYTTSSSPGGIQFKLTGTCTATEIIYEGFTFSAGALVQQTRSTSLGTVISNQTGLTAGTVIIEGFIQVNAGGFLQIEFAQSTPSGTSSVLKGSHFQKFFRT